MTLSLTNRIKDIMYYMGMFLIGLWVFSTAKCKDGNTPDITYRSRAGGPYVGLIENNTDTVYLYHGVDGEKIDTILPKSTNQLYLRKIDTLDIVVANYLGRSLTVDAATSIKEIFFRITNELRTDSTLRK